MTSLTTADGQKFTYAYLNVNPVSSSDPAYGVAVTSVSNFDYVLQTVTFPGSSNLQVTYQYTNTSFPWAMTGVVDERGIQISSWTYGSDARVSQNSRAGGVDTYQVAYDATNSKTTVTNPLNKQTIYPYNTSVNGPSVVTQVQGVASAHCTASNTTYAFDSNNYISSVTDGEGRVTAYVNNSRGDPTSTTYGSGTAAATTTTETWHATLNVPTQIVQPGLTTNFTWTNGQLTQVIQTDTTSQTVPFSTKGRTRTWTYAYGKGGLSARSIDRWPERATRSPTLITPAGF